MSTMFWGDAMAAGCRFSSKMEVVSWLQGRVVYDAIVLFYSILFGMALIGSLQGRWALLPAVRRCDDRRAHGDCVDIVPNVCYLPCKPALLAGLPNVAVNRHVPVPEF